MHWLLLLSPRRPQWAREIYGEDPPRREDQSNPPIASWPSPESREGARPGSSCQQKAQGQIFPNGFCTVLLPIRAPGQQRTKLGNKLLELVSPDLQAHPEWCHLASSFSTEENMTLKDSKWVPHCWLGAIGPIPGSSLYSPGLSPSPQPWLTVYFAQFHPSMLSCIHSLRVCCLLEDQKYHSEQDRAYHTSWARHYLLYSPAHGTLRQEDYCKFRLHSEFCVCLNYRVRPYVQKRGGSWKDCSEVKSAYYFWKDLSLVPSIHIRWLPTTCHSSPRRPDTFF